MLVDGPTWALKILLVAHAIAAGVLLGASTHFAWLTRRADRAIVALHRTYASVALVSYATVFALGASMYPHYRVRVRAEWLDAHARWAAILFDVKENFALLLAPVMIAQWLLTRSDGDARRRSILRTCAWIAASVLWFDAIAGLIVASYRSV